QMVRISPRPNGRELSGVIVSSVTSGVSELGESNQVYVDKGKADGVEVGNTFVVVRKGDGLSAGPLDSGHVSSAYMAGEAGMRASTVKTPDENVGLLLVVDVKDKLSIAMVVKSVRELKSRGGSSAANGGVALPRGRSGPRSPRELGAGRSTQGRGASAPVGARRVSAAARTKREGARGPLRSRDPCPRGETRRRGRGPRVRRAGTRSGEGARRGPRARQARGG